MSDAAQDALREAFDKLPRDIPWQLVQKCYQVEVEYLHDRDRENAVDDLKRAVAIFVDHELGTGE